MGITPATDRIYALTYGTDKRHPTLAYVENGNFCLIQQSGNQPSGFPRPLPQPDGTLEDNVRDLLGDRECRPNPLLTPGIYHPRIARGPHTPTPSATPHYRDFRSTVANLNLLARDLDELFETIQPAEENLGAYGHRIRRVLVLACTEVERAWHGIAMANDLLSKGTGNVGDYYQLHQPMRLGEWLLEIEFAGDLVECAPFGAWEKGRPPHWWRAYNESKHDHAKQLEAATLETACHAVTAAFVMGWAQFGKAALQSRPHSIRANETPTWEPWELYFRAPTGEQWTSLPLAETM